MASSSNSSVQKSFKYDVFISFRGEDTRKTFVDHLYEALKDKCIYTYKDDERIEQGKTIDKQLIQAIRGSRFFIIVFSQNYASSSWCLDELVEIMECQKTGEQIAYPVFFDVEPTHVRYQSGAFGKAFLENKNKDDAGKWIEALKGASNLAGRELKATVNGHEAKFINKIVQEISLELRSINYDFDEKLVGMETRVEDVVSYLEIGIDKVRMIGIKGMGGAGKTTLARAVFDHLSHRFEATSFVENVREASNGSDDLKKLQEQVLLKVLNERVTLDSVNDGKNIMKRRMCGKKVLLVLDDVDHMEQLKALAGEPKWFKPGSRILITTRDEQVLVAHRVDVIRDIVLLSEKEAISLFSRYAFGRENPVQGYEELSGKVVCYAAGLPLTLEVFGSFLCGKHRVEWLDAIKRLEKIPLKETLEKLELSYIGLEDDYKEIFLDIACILKGETKEDAIIILESCGFHARNGLKVLEQRSLITISKPFEALGMHDHIEEMGKNIVRRSREPNEHSRLWIDEEIEAILANDMGTQETRCLKLDMWSRNIGNARILMKGLGKMKELGYLELNVKRNFDFERDDACLGKMKILRYLKLKILGKIEQKRDEATQYFPNSLKYLKCLRYPFLYLPKTFEANNLVGLEMECCFSMVQLWKERKKKVLIKLKFLSLSFSKLSTFDFGMTPNLETLSLKKSYYLKELCMPVTCQKLKHLDISRSKLRTFDLGLTPNLETLSLLDCAHFVELHVSAACPNLKILDLSNSRLRSLDLELILNLERLDLGGCRELVEINAPVGCLKKVVYLNLMSCLRFSDFEFDGECEPKANCSLATLNLVGQSLDLCPLHPNSNLPKLQFHGFYEEDLPSSVGNIEKLISFGLCACTDFQKFSDMICSLRCLKELTLECNIPEFPKDLGQLECLEELYLSSAEIEHLPDSICMLKRLKSLEVNTCDLLEKLPEDLGKLECLEELVVSSKKIEYLPDSICMLKHLKSLEISEGDLLEKLPGDLGQLECLEKLHVRSKKIKYLPDSICMLKRLKSLKVSKGDLFEKLPEDLGRLECLEKLHVRSKKIEYLPDSICMLKHLKSLKVSKGDLLEKLPGDLGRLECLEKLCVNGRKIEYLPDSICMLKSLKSLDVSNCSCLGKLPEDIDQLESLESLDLGGTMIKHLPGSICMLKHLKYLNLHCCDLLEKLPEDLGQLECLKELIITYTSINHLPQSIFGLKGLCITASLELLQLYDFPSEIKTRDW